MRGSLKGRIQNFLNKIPEPDENGCIKWPGSSNTQGYGGGVLTVGNYTYYGAHRVAYFIEYGEFNKTLHVLHKCDNPKCVNPDHLFLGTHEDNMADMVAKGRSNNKWSNL